MIEIMSNSWANTRKPGVKTEASKMQSVLIKTHLHTLASIMTQISNEGCAMARLWLDWIPSFFGPLMKHFNLAPRQLCLWPSAVTSSTLLSSIWEEWVRTPLQGKLIFTEDAVLRCTNLQEIWLPFINQDMCAPVHRRCLPSHSAVFSACWLTANTWHTTLRFKNSWILW